MDYSKCSSWLCFFILLFGCGYCVSLLFLTSMANGHFQTPRMDIEAVTYRDFSLMLTNGSIAPASWVVNGNMMVTYQPHKASDQWYHFRHRYLSIIVSAHYKDALWAKTIVEQRFTQNDDFPDTVLNAHLIISNQYLNQTMGSALQDFMQRELGIHMKIKIETYVKIRNAWGWHHKPRWYFLTCRVALALPIDGRKSYMLSKLCM